MDIPYIFHIFFLNMFHIVSLLCFLIFAVRHTMRRTMGSGKISTHYASNYGAGVLVRHTMRRTMGWWVELDTLFVYAMGARSEFDTLCVEVFLP